MAQSKDNARNQRLLRPSDLTFEEARAILERASNEAKQALARQSHEPEILAFLAQDDDGLIRALVAGNSATPGVVDLKLADDELAEVRLELANKIVRLMPGISLSEATQLCDEMLAVLEKLAEDRLPRVRQIVAEVIKSSPDVPKGLVLQLAHDAELSVSAPILEYSPLLSDNDLLEVIATSKVEGILAPIARRKGLRADVSDAVVATLDIPAIAALLANSDAKIRSKTMNQIISHAVDIDALHESLVLRPELSIRAIKRISGFVASSLIDILCKRHDLDDETRRHISRCARARVQEEDLVREQDIVIEDNTWRVVSAACSAGQLDDDFMIDAIGAEDWPRVILALVALGCVPEGLVLRILKSSSGALIAAFAWHCGLQMRTAFALQKDYARLGPANLLLARNGTDFPQTEDQMRNQLEILGIVPQRA